MNGSKRKFLVGALGVVVFAAAAPYLYFKTKKSDPSDIVIAILHRRLGYLNVTNDAFASFAEDYLVFRAGFKRQLTLLSIFSTPLRYFSPYALLDMNHPARRLEDNVVSNFLLSTDFFDNEANPNRLIAYKQFYDPMKQACSNPFHEFA